MSANIQVSDDPIVVRPSSLSITTSFDASPTAVDMRGWNQAMLFCDLTLNTATDVRIQIEAASPVSGPGGATIAPVAADWHSVGYLDTGSATGTTTKLVPYAVLELQLAASGRYVFPLPTNYKYLRFKAKTTAGPGSTTLKLMVSQGIV